MSTIYNAKISIIKLFLSLKQLHNYYDYKIFDISSIAMFNYDLAKFPTELLDPVIPKGHCRKDLIIFLEEICQVMLDDDYLLTFGTIDLPVDLIFQNKPNLKTSGDKLKKLFRFTMSIHFFFNQNFYDQKERVLMGSPLGSALTNFFIGHNEKNWL